MKHLINWVEIPSLNINKSKKFYEEILGGLSFHDMEMEGSKYALFPSEDKFNSGALVQSDYHQPSSDGVTVYLDGGNDMDIILNKVAKAGGTVIMPKTYTGPDAGYVGMFLDIDGNKIGLQHP